MASACESIPVETQFATQIVTSNSLSTSFSVSVSTGPSVSSTSVTCLDSPPPTPGGVCATPSSTVIVASGPTSTVSVPVVTTVPVTRTTSNPTRTLFSTSCAPTTPPSSPPTSSPPPTPSTSPGTFTSASSNGTVVTTNSVLTTLSPSSVYVTATAPAFNSDRPDGPSSKVAPLVGGVVGGVIGLFALIGGIWYIWRRSQHWNDIFDREIDEKEQRQRMSLGDEDVQPRPYHYGLVGYSASPTPPGSPPLGATQRGGHSPSNSLSLLNAAVGVHSRTSSGLDGSPRSMSRSRSDLTPTPSGHGGRPNLSTASTSASNVPLLERSVNPPRPHSSGSPGAQSGSTFDGRATQAQNMGPRPHSAGGSLPSGAAAAAIPGATSTSANWASTAHEKQRLHGSLPMGAAAPIPPVPAVPPIPAPEISVPRSAAPPLTPRNPHRPRSSSRAGVLVHVDGGSIAGPSHAGDQPPVYSPT